MRIPVVLLASVLGVCVACAPMTARAGGQTAVPADGQPFTLKEGASAVVGADRLRVTFDRVLSESRCPVDVQCIQAGEATIVVRVQPSGASATTVTLSTHDARSMATAGDWDVALRTLLPVPRATAPRARGPYTATLVVTAHDAR